MCQACDDRPMLVRDVCLDDISILALSLVRFVAAGYMTGDVACWETAYGIADDALCETDGPVFIATMTGIMRAIRVERSEEWQFMPASCCRVTSAEAQLVQLLAAARAGEAGRLARMARAITGGAARRLYAAAFAAADLMERHASFHVGPKPETQRRQGWLPGPPERLH